MKLKHYNHIIAALSFLGICANVQAMKSRETVYNLIKRGTPPMNLGSMLNQQLAGSQGLTIAPVQRNNQQRFFATKGNRVGADKYVGRTLLASALGLTVVGTVAALVYYYQALEFAKTLDWSTPSNIALSLSTLKSVYPLLSVRQTVMMLRTLQVNANAKDYYTGFAPLHCAVRNVDKDAVFGARVLLELGASCKATDKQKLLAIDHVEVAYYKKVSGLQSLYDFNDPDGLWRRQLTPSDQKRVSCVIQETEAAYKALKSLLKPS